MLIPPLKEKCIHFVAKLSGEKLLNYINVNKIIIGGFDNDKFVSYRDINFQYI